MLKKSCLVLVTIVVLFGCWAFTLAQAPKPIESRWISGLYKKKEEEASAVTGPKFVIIGGSGTHFSYSARLISQQTGLKVVNLGSHAGLGGAYILHRAMSSLRPGDTAILTLEQQLLADTPPSSILVNYVITSDPGYLLTAPKFQVLPLLFGYSPAQFLRQVAANLMPWTSPLYRPETIDNFGDETANTPANKQPYMAQAVKSAGPISIELPDPNRPPKYLVDFAIWAKRNNIRLIQAWPATVDRDAYHTEKFISYFRQYSEVFVHLGFERIGKQLDFLIPENDMLDSLYHADSNGAQLASNSLAVDLCRVVKCLGQLASK